VKPQIAFPRHQLPDVRDVLIGPGVWLVIDVDVKAQTYTAIRVR
jgi:hypothetical protein